LHDDLGTALTGVALEIDVARRMFRTEHVSGSAPLAESASRIRALAERMREVVWAVNPRCDTVSSLASFLEQQAGTLLRPGGVRVRFDFPEDIPALPLDSETRHQLALAVREALTNVLRHSHAAEVVLGLALGEDAFIVSVQDDGRGFDAAGVGREAGHGLHNLRVRLERVGGVASIESSPGQGTRIELRVPLEGRQRKDSSDE
jgi:signal transduction histidine kinase